MNGFAPMTLDDALAVLAVSLVQYGPRQWRPTTYRRPSKRRSDSQQSCRRQDGGNWGQIKVALQQTSDGVCDFLSYGRITQNHGC